jgi:NAD(P)-dependent dehydrogenase (short-subunit alcohol dehydrogenase family)
MTGELDGKVALVTGATRGLGLAIARGLAEAGASVVVSSRKAEACEKVAVEISAELGVPTLALPLHVGQWDAIEPAVARVVEQLGQLDIVVNNAGIAPLAPSLLEVGESLFDKTMDVDLKGPFRLMAVAGAHMRDRGTGSIINISSIGAHRPSPAEAMYAAAKNGLNALTQAFAQEYAPHVRVNCIMPGAFATDMAADWDDDFIGLVTRGLPAQRLGRPDEIVGMVVHLAGDRAGYTTGSIIAVDGGRTAVY